MKLIRLTCALLIFSLLAAVVFSFSSVAGEKDGYDFSYPSATVTEEISADEFLKEYVSGISLSDVEANYLREQSGFLFAFNKNIPTSYVDVNYENGVLTVSADEYKYVAENGVSVVWKPVSATLYSEKKSLSASSYTATFSGVYAKDKDAVTVEYKASFKIASEEVNRLFTDEKISTSVDPVITSARQHASLMRAGECIDAAIAAYSIGMPPDAASSDIELALGAIGELDGRSVSENVVGDIFSRFCVGK